MTKAKTTLCFPDGEKSCFGCCPPIRPAGYDHLDYRGMISRMLLENTKAFNPARQDIRPITGFSCWAIGYLDESYSTVGCLLHPYRYGGVDMRYRVSFEDKCRRETCEEAKIFQALSCRAQTALLRPVKGMDSFTYSSGKANPLFRMLMWGSPLLESVANETDEAEGHLPRHNEAPFKSWNNFIRRYPFFASSLNPKAHSYIVTSIVQRLGTIFLRKDESRDELELFSAAALARIRKLGHVESGRQAWTHLLDLPKPFLDYLRLGAGIARITQEGALEIKAALDSMIATAFF